MESALLRVAIAYAHALKSQDYLSLASALADLLRSILSSARDGNITPDILMDADRIVSGINLDPHSSVASERLCMSVSRSIIILLRMIDRTKGRLPAESIDEAYSLIFAVHATAA